MNECFDSQTITFRSIDHPFDFAEKIWEYMPTGLPTLYRCRLIP